MYDVIVLIWVGFIFLAALFFTGISFTCLVQSHQFKFGKGLLLSSSACLLAVILCFSIWPAMHRVYDDEFTFISQSINILSTGHANVILKGTRIHPEAFASWTANPKLPGYACLEALVLLFTNDFEHSFFMLNIVLGSLSVAIVFRIVLGLSASYRVAWWSAIFLACLPARITYSMSAASDVSGMFFFLLFFLFLIEYRTHKLKRIVYTALFCGIFSICIKPMYGAFVILGLALALRAFLKEGLLDKKLFNQLLLDIVCLYLPIICAIPVMFSSDVRTGHYSVTYILNNLQTSLSYLFNFKQNTVITTVFALLAVGRSVFYKKDVLVTRLAWWFLAGFLAFSVFNSGGISYPGHAYSDRYFLFLAFPFVVLAAKGLVDTNTGKRFFALGIMFFILLLANSVLACIHLNVQAKYAFHNQNTLFLKQINQIIPPEAYFIDESAALVATMTSMKTIQTDLFLNGDHPGKIVLLKGSYDELFYDELFYDLFDTKKINLFKNILMMDYQCKPLTTLPLTEDRLSASPYCCYQKPS